MIKAVLFDMDGLLVDTEGINNETWQIAKKHYHIESDDKFRREVIGTNNENSRRIHAREFGDDFPFDEVMNFRKNKFFEIIGKRGIKAKKGALELLEYLKEHKIDCALVTSTNRDRIGKYMESVNEDVFSYFKVIVDGTMVKECKPDPETYLLAAKLINVPIENCLVLEDSINGCKAGIRANAKTIMVPDLVEPSDEIKNDLFCVCNNLLEVKDLLEN